MTLDAKALEAARKRLQENLDSFDNEVAYHLSTEGERADLWTEIDVLADDLRTVLSSLPHAGKVSEELLQDPNAVHLNMLRGTIGKPSVGQIVHVYGAAALSEALSSQQAEAVPVGWLDINDEARSGKRILLLWKPFCGISEHVELGWWSATQKAWTNTYGKPFGGDPDKWAPLAPFSPSPADAGEPSEIAQIKPLVWHGPDFEDDYWAYALDKTYTIGRHVDQGRWLGGVGGYFPSVEAAKAAAQADFETRIRSALVPATSQAKGGAEEEALASALKEACGVMETLVDPDSQHVSSATIWAQAIAASRRGRAALRSSSPVGQTAKEGGE